MRSVLRWDGSGTVFDSRNFPEIEAVLSLFRCGGIRHQIVGESGGSRSPSLTYVISRLDLER